MHVAFKATYNDGKEHDQILGFKGVCTIDNIKRNIKAGRVNCSLPNNPCRVYYDSGFKGNSPQDNPHCYETNLFNKWEFGSGMYHSGDKNGQYIPMKKASSGDIAVLTTRFPGTSEEERKIIAAYRIEKIEKVIGPYQSIHNLLQADKNLKIELTRDLAEKFNFWQYHKGEPIWGTGLFRYMGDDEVSDFLNDIILVDRSENNKLIAKQLLNILPANAATPSSKIPRLTRQAMEVLRIRKVGPAGEGENHRMLKEWIANHPEYLNLTDVVKTEVEEHFFPSNDLPDIVFTCSNGEIVSAEIETDFPVPGAYQAIKYKSLMCAEQNLPLNSPKVRSFLVAYSIPEDLKGFCDFYGIETVEKRLTEEEKKKLH